MKGFKKIFKANESNSDLIEKYLSFYKIKKPEASKHTIRSKRQALEKLSHYLENNTEHKSLDKAIEKDMLNFFGNDEYVTIGSRNQIGIHIIPFYRWKLGLYKKERPPNMRWFETTSKQAKKRNKDPHRKEKLYITAEDYEKMTNYSKDVYNQNRAIWETYYISGFRPEELQSMSIEDVIINNDNSVNVVCPKSKTNPRNITLVIYPDNLIRYIGNHPQRKNKKAPLWFHLTSSNKLNQLSMEAIRRRFRDMRKDLGLKNTITIKSFRKTRASKFFQSDNKKINDNSFIAWYMGWDEHTVVERRKEYNLIDNEDFKKAIIKEPMIPKDYDRLEKDLETYDSKYKPKLDKQEKRIKDLEKRLKQTNNVLEDNRDGFLKQKKKVESLEDELFQFKRILAITYSELVKIYEKEFKKESSKEWKELDKKYNLDKIMKDWLNELKKEAKSLAEDTLDNSTIG